MPNDKNPHRTLPVTLVMQLAGIREVQADSFSTSPARSRSSCVTPFAVCVLSAIVTFV